MQLRGTARCTWESIARFDFANNLRDSINFQPSAPNWPNRASIVRISRSCRNNFSFLSVRAFEELSIKILFNIFDREKELAIRRGKKLRDA